MKQLLKCGRLSLGALTVSQKIYGAVDHLSKQADALKGHVDKFLVDVRSA